MYKIFLKKGISCVFVDSNKRAIIPWKKFQAELPTEAELDSQSLSNKAHGIAAICGAVSGNLEIIDIDCKYDLTGTLFNDYLAAVPDDLLKGMYIVATKNNGYHIYYRCEKIEGNLKLASRPTSEEERKRGAHLSGQQGVK